MTVQGARPQREPPRLHEVWVHIKNRLSTAVMNNILQGAGRIYAPGEYIKSTEGAETTVWSRLVLSPIVTPWAIQEELGRHKLSPFLLRVDLFRPEGHKVDVNKWLEAAHVEAFKQLQSWAPPDDMVYAKVEHPIHREIPPQPSAIWDAERGLFFMSATYHVYVSPKRFPA